MTLNHIGSSVYYHSLVTLPEPNINFAPMESVGSRSFFCNNKFFYTSVVFRIFTLGLGGPCRQQQLIPFKEFVISQIPSWKSRQTMETHKLFFLHFFLTNCCKLFIGSLECQFIFDILTLTLMSLPACLPAFEVRGFDSSFLNVSFYPFVDTTFKQ